MVINVEYNQLDPLLRATGHEDGDVNDETGYSPFPGNINQVSFWNKLIIWLSEHTTYQSRMSVSDIDVLKISGLLYWSLSSIKLKWVISWKIHSIFSAPDENLTGSFHNVFPIPAGKGRGGYIL